MLRGIKLTLLIGPAVPILAPRVVIDSLTSVEVSNRGEQNGFRLEFTTGKTSPLLAVMLPAGFFDPMTTRVIIIVTLNGLPNVLADGIVTNQDISPDSEPGQSKLTITGEDISAVMDVVEMPFLRYPGMADNVIVSTILARYAVLGLVPVVIPPIIPDVPLPTKRIPAQMGTDLQYIRQLARKQAYVFYIEPGPAPGSNIAYWGPDLRIPNPQPALNVNMDAHTNVKSLSFNLDGMKKKIVVITIFDPVTGKVPIPIPIPNISVLRPPLGAKVALPSKVEFPETLGKHEGTKAIANALGIVFRASDSISGSGSLDVMRYGRVLKARQLVGVRGVGLAYDGLYYVNSVTHNIKHGEYTQNFNLSRDGMISLTPRVMP